MLIMKCVYWMIISGRILDGYGIAATSASCNPCNQGHVYVRVDLSLYGAIKSDCIPTTEFDLFRWCGVKQSRNKKICSKMYPIYGKKTVHIIQIDPSHIISNSSLKVLNDSFHNWKEKRCCFWTFWTQSGCSICGGGYLSLGGAIRYSMSIHKKWCFRDFRQYCRARRHASASVGHVGSAQRCILILNMSSKNSRQRLTLILMIWYPNPLGNILPS